MKPESDTARFVRLLGVLRDANGRPMFTAADEPEADVAAFAELIRDGYIDGTIQSDGLGIPRRIANLKIRVSGRAFLDELSSKEALKTSVGLIKHHRWSAYAWLLSTMGGAVFGYVFRYLTEGKA